MTTALIWLRRDLRLNDHAALTTALLQHDKVVPVFILDSQILSRLPAEDRRVSFILASLATLKSTLQQHGSDLLVRHGDPRILIPELAQQYAAQAVYANRDYEPSAIARDQQVALRLHALGIAWYDSKDQVIFERDEILTQAGKPFSVFTPYWRQWQARLNDTAIAPFSYEGCEHRLAALTPEALPSHAQIGFVPCDLGRIAPGEPGAYAVLDDFLPRMARYQALRDFPAKKGVSYLSVHLRFGTLSIRTLVRAALEQDNEGAMCWLKELCWRDFYQQLLWHRPHLCTDAFKIEFDTLPFPNNRDWFTAWCTGLTGYPLVDAGMRQLNQTGFMHNRLRMITSSFLVKDLLIDWRWGEAYFAEKLLDFDLASNNGGWQWAASVGCDAQPWFRIFNPITQSQKFDPDGQFIRRYCPELTKLDQRTIHAPWQASAIELQAVDVQLGRDYPYPLVNHASQREAALALFKAASTQKKSEY